jgi:DNA-directed RNA polymerase specialized sigma subunit
VISGKRDRDLVALDEAMQALVVELRFFGGLTTEKTAEVLKVSTITVMRDWSTAKGWLYREMSSEGGHGLQSVEPNR